jgi:hypothetical protein
MLLGKSFHLFFKKRELIKFQGSKIVKVSEHREKFKFSEKCYYVVEKKRLIVKSILKGRIRIIFIGVQEKKFAAVLDHDTIGWTYICIF